MILVTGATGFVGKRLVPLLKNKPVLVLAKNENSKFEIDGRKILQKNNIKFELVDLKTGFGLKKYSAQTIIHMAANTNTADFDHSVNDKGTINLFKSLEIKPTTHIVFVSSAATMAGGIGNPTNEYGRSKYRAEQFLLAMQKKLSFKLTIIRPTTIFGENPRNDSMFDFIQTSLSRHFPLIYLNWPGKTGFVYVDDVAKFIVNSLKPEKRLNIYNLATECLRFDSVVEMVAKKHKFNFKRIDLPNIFWQMCSKCRFLVYSLEPLFFSSFYNLIWRSTLIVDDVLCFETTDIKTKLNSKLITVEQFLKL